MSSIYSLYYDGHLFKNTPDTLQIVSMSYSSMEKNHKKVIFPLGYFLLNNLFRSHIFSHRYVGTINYRKWQWKSIISFFLKKLMTFLPWIDLTQLATPSCIIRVLSLKTLATRHVVTTKYIIIWCLFEKNPTIINGKNQMHINRNEIFFRLLPNRVFSFNLEYLLILSL